MTDIFSEVEEELRKDKYNILLRKYGLWIAGAAFLIIILVAGYELAWKPWRFSHVANASDQYNQAVQALTENSPALAGEYLDQLAEGDHAGYRVLALMQQAALAAEDGDAPRAAALYDQAAGLAGEGPLAEFARIKSLYIVADDLSYGELLARAEPLSTDSAFRFSALELIAAGALKEGDLSRARSEYQFLTQAPSTPGGIRRRAQEGLAAVALAELELAEEAETQ